MASINEQLLSKTELDSKWKESYIEKHDKFVQKTLDDNDKMRVQMIDLEAKQRAIRDEFTQISTNIKLRGQNIKENSAGILHLQKKVTHLTKNKIDEDTFKGFREQTDLLLTQFKEKLENNTNHFAMVENFVEKYIPVRIQSQISESL